VITLLITLIATVVPGTAAWLMVLRWPRADPMTPAVSAATLKGESRRLRRAVAYLNSKFSPESTTSVALGATGLLVVVGAAGVGLLVLMIHSNTGLARWDHAASLFAAHHASKSSDRVLRVFTQLGGALVIVPLAVIVAVIETLRQRTVKVVAFLTLVVGGQFLVANFTKFLVDRARPAFDQLTGFSGSSFPSGHAVATAAGLSAFALVIGRGRSLRTRAVLAGAAVGLATGVSCTRVMLGVHWLTDVLGGLAIGWAWFAICSVAFGGRQLRFGAPAKLAEASDSTVP
jgi:membrane-associated phospholipid phosphatase